VHTLLARIFRIQSGEGQKVLLFSLLGALMSGGLTIGMSAVDAVFLSGAGAERLPLIYVLTPLMMLLYMPLFSLLLAKVGIDRLFDIMLGVLVTGGIVLYALLSRWGLDQPLWVLLLIKLYANLWLYALYTLYWNFTDRYFDILDAKRLFSFFTAGSAFGAMGGGVLVAMLISYMDLTYLFLVWSGITLLGLPLLVYIRRTNRVIDLEESLDETEPGFGEQMRLLGRTLRTSRYVKLLVATTFGTLAIALICEYQYMHIFSAWANNTATRMAPAAQVETYASQELAALFGQLNAYVNALNLLVNLFLFNRLIVWLGVRNMALIQSLVYLIAFSALLLTKSFPAAVFGFFAYQGVMFAIDQNNQNFLYNALPAEGRKQMRAFIECVCEPFAVAFAGLFLILFARDVDTFSVQALWAQIWGEESAAWWTGHLRFGMFSFTDISIFGLLAAVVTIALTFKLRPDYVRAMILNLKRSWLDFSSSGRSDALAMPPALDSRSVLPLLAATRAIPPYARRQAEDLIVRIGLKSVPALVTALMDRHLSMRSRSIAVRALARLSFAQFEALEDELIDAELRQAYTCARMQRCLENTALDTHGLYLLSRYYQDTQDLTLDFVLELLTIGGRLPSYELLAASLRSPNPKERANAIETIEQGCSAQRFRLLLPLIGQHNLDERCRIAGDLLTDEAPALAELLAHASQSPHPVECAAATEAIWDASPPGTRDRLLRDARSETVQKAVDQLRKRDQAAAITDVEKLSRLARAPFFKAFGIEELFICMPEVTREVFPDQQLLYRAEADADAVFLIISGAVELDMHGTRWTRETGETVGEDAVMGAVSRSVDAVSKGATVLRISKHAILETARTYPRVALGLLAKTWMN
jgi:ATP:ADP antiporter, AAA family